MDEPFSIRPGPSIEIYRYTGPEGEIEFEVGRVYWGGEPVLRDGHAIVVVYPDFRRVGDRSGEQIDDESCARILGNLRTYYRRRGLPYEIHHRTGEREDESGQLRPGFASALPRASHSDGWSLTDLYLSPEFPDPEVYPPTIAYAGPEGSAELTRTFTIVDEVRHERFHDVPVKVWRRVLHPGSLHWTGDRTGEPMTDADRARITERVRSVYDEWGYTYEVEESPPGRSR